MAAEPLPAARVFKTAWFAKAARKARIRDAELCAAIGAVMAGRAVDLGGGVFKKRLNNNMHRSIILGKARRIWVYEYLFAKNDRENIDDDELAGFRVLAKRRSSLNAGQLNALIDQQHLLEICHDR